MIFVTALISLRVIVSIRAENHSGLRPLRPLHVQRMSFTVALHELMFNQTIHSFFDHILPTNERPPQEFDYFRAVKLRRVRAGCAKDTRWNIAGYSCR